MYRKQKLPPVRSALMNNLQDLGVSADVVRRMRTEQLGTHIHHTGCSLPADRRFPGSQTVVLYSASNQRRTLGR